MLQPFDIVRAWYGEEQLSQPKEALLNEVKDDWKPSHAKFDCFFEPGKVNSDAWEECEKRIVEELEYHGVEIDRLVLKVSNSNAVDLYRNPIHLSYMSSRYAPLPPCLPYRFPTNIITAYFIKCSISCGFSSWGTLFSLEMFL